MRRVQRRLEGKAPDQQRAPTDARTVWFNAWTAPEAQVLEGLVRSVLDQLDSNLLRRIARKRKLLSVLGLGASIAGGFFGLGNVVDRVWEKVSIDPKQRNELNQFVREAMEKWLANADQATPTLATKHSVEMIDEAKPGEVGIIVMEGTLDIAAMGNLMATAAIERGMAGMVLDGAIRDLWDVRRMGLTVYARSKSPRTAVGHYATVARNVPVECGGITVRPGDIIVADEDGVVVVPQEHAAAVLKQAQAIDDRERGMYPFIREFKSLQKAIAKFNRI
jgi:regulator of RNase E activity RraA